MTKPAATIARGQAGRRGHNQRRPSVDSEAIAGVRNITGDWPPEDLGDLDLLGCSWLSAPAIDR